MPHRPSLSEAATRYWGSETKLSTFRPSCNTTLRKRKSGTSGKKVTHSDHNFSNALALSNRFQVLQEIDKNDIHENVHVECSTPCHMVAGYSELSHNDQATLSSLGDGILQSNVLGEVHSNFLTRNNEHSPELVTSKKLTNRMRAGYKNQHMSNANQSVQPELGIKKDMAITESYLPHLENDLIVDPSAANHFSKSFHANTEVLQAIRQQCQDSRDFRLSKIQNGHEFGFIRLTDIKTYQGPLITWDKEIDILEAHSIIRNSGVPKFLKCRIPVQTQLRPKVWAQKLKHYWDQQLPDLIAFGFPLDFDRSKQLISTLENHASAKEHVSHIEKYIQEDLTYGALYGPY